MSIAQETPPVTVKARSFAPALRLPGALQTFRSLLDRRLSEASIAFVHDGSRFVVGARHVAPTCTVHVAHSQFFADVLSRGNLGLAENYIDDGFRVDGGHLDRFLTVLLRARLNRLAALDPRLLLSVGAIRAQNRLRGATQNVQRHYDLGDDLFESFLDSTLTYSCGYATAPDDALEQLQQNKLERLCAKLQLSPGDRLLDIGCGYGGLLIHAARTHGVTGVGITLSKRHHALARRRVEEAGLSSRVSIEFRDHRSLAGDRPYDKIVSVGMMEHLRRADYDVYIANIAAALDPKGRGLVHTIGCGVRTNKHDPFIQKYIFPGSGQPRLSEIVSRLERRSLAVLDVENIVRHYAITCSRWREKFHEHAASLSARYSARVQRMWDYYLCCGIAAALEAESAVYQVLFAGSFSGERPLQRV